MARGSGFSRWLIALATANPPAGRADWARAMRAEYEALDQGRMGWALGCLSAAAGWRLRADAVLFLGMGAMVFALVELLPLAEFWLSVWLGAPYDAASRFVGYGWVWGPLALACMALAALRPRHWVFVGLVMPFVFEGFVFIKGALAFHTPISKLFDCRIMDARIDVGVGSLIGYALMGALVGHYLKGTVRRPGQT